MRQTGFLMSFCAALLIAGAVAAGQDDGIGRQRDGGPDDPRPGRVRVMLENGDYYRPGGLLLGAQMAGGNFDGAHLLGLGQPVETRDEDRIDLGQVPYMGSIVAQESVNSDFRGAMRVGDAYRMEDYILVAPLSGVDGAALAGRSRTTVIADRKRSFWIGERFLDSRGHVMPLAEIPALGTLLRIGVAYEKDGKLLILIAPRVLPDE